MSDEKSPRASLFERKRRRRSHGVRVIVTGQVGLDKKPFIDQVVGLIEKSGRDIRAFHVGDLMYAEAPDVVPGRILDLPRQRLTTLRRSIFKDILAATASAPNGSSPTTAGGTSPMRSPGPVASWE